MQKNLFRMLFLCLGLIVSLPLYSASLNDANELLDREAYEEAIIAYDALGPQSPAKREAWRLNNWALCYLRTNRPAKAIPLLEKAIEVKKDNSTAWNNLGSAYERTGDKVKAVDVYKMAVKTMRQQLDEYWAGTEDRDKFKAQIPNVEAGGLIEEPTVLNAEDTKEKVQQAKNLLDEGKLKEASLLYATIGKTRYSKREGWKFNNWGLCYLKLADEDEVGSKKNLQEALTRFRKSVEAYEDNAVAWNNLGVTYEKLGGLFQARDAYAMAMKAADDAETTQLRAELNKVKVEFLIEKKNAEVERQ